ncbi:MAG: phage major capsid protein [Deltaproteobacteria bacterium]|nr:phage major capsid protein [Deltaproteobacteria bacterium]
MGQATQEAASKDLDKLANEVKSLKERSEKASEKLSSAKDKIAELEKEKSSYLAHGRFPIAGNRTSSDESRALKFFGKGHPRDLLDVNTGDPKWSGVPEECKAIVRQLKESIDISRWLCQVYHGAPRDGSDDRETVSSVKGMLETAYGRSVLAPRCKAFGSTVVGEGDEWVPTAISSTFVEEFELDRRVEGMVRTLQMTTNPWELPVQKDVTKAKVVAEGAQAISQNFATNKLVFNAKKFQEFTVLPEELNEDSAVPILSLLRSELVEAQQRAVEAATINGDTAGTHQDSDTDALPADVAEKAWDGFRKLAIANSANGGTVTFGSGVTDAKLREMRTKLGKFGVNPRDLMWLPSPLGYQQMLGTDDVVTVEKFGPQATVLSGALASYQGIPIVISEFMRDDLNASGVYDGVTTDNTGILLVNHRRYYYGLRRPIRIRVMQDLPSYDRWLLASFQRKDFVGHPQSATEVSSVYGIDITI